MSDEPNPPNCLSYVTSPGASILNFSLVSSHHTGTRKRACSARAEHWRQGSVQLNAIWNWYTCAWNYQVTNWSLQHAVEDILFNRRQQSMTSIINFVLLQTTSHRFHIIAVTPHRILFVHNWPRGEASESRVAYEWRALIPVRWRAAAVAKCLRWQVGIAQYVMSCYALSFFVMSCVGPSCLYNRQTCVSMMTHGLSCRQRQWLWPLGWRSSLDTVRCNRIG